MNGKKYRLWAGLGALGVAAVCLLTGCQSAPKNGSTVSKDMLGAGNSGQFLEVGKAVADLDYFFRTVEKVHYNHLAVLSKGDYQMLKERLKNSLRESANTNGGRVSRAVLALTVAEGAAALGDGHTSCHLDRDVVEPSKDEVCMPPFRMEWRAGGIFIADTILQLQSWKGAHLVGINSQDLKEALRPIWSRISGERWEHRMADFLRNQEPYWALIRPVQGTEMSLSLERGKGPAAQAEGISDLKFEISKLQQRTGEPQVVKVGLISRAQYRKEVPPQPERPSWGNYTFFDKDRICYWQYNSCNAAPQVLEWMEGVFREVQEKRATHLILDLRFNGGGDDAACEAMINHLTDKPYRMYSRISGRISESFLRNTSQWYLRPLKGLRLSFARRTKKPKDVANRFTGKVYALTSPYTFSAAADMTHVLKDYGIATIVGEETGGVRECYGEACGERLPNSGLGFNVSCKRFYAPSPKPDDSKRGTVPDIILTEELLEPFRGLGDPEVSFVLGLIGKGESGKSP